MVPDSTQTTEISGMFPHSTTGRCLLNLSQEEIIDYMDNRLEIIEKEHIRPYSSKRLSDLSNLRILLEYMQYLGPSNSMDDNLINRAALDGKTDVVEAMISMGAKPNNRGVSGRTPLHDAARSGRTGTIRFLLSHGADVEARSKTGRTALHWAADEGHYEAAQVLLQAGAKVDAVSDYGLTPADYATNKGHSDIFNLLLNY